MSDPYKRVGITRSELLWHGGAPGIAVGDFVEPETVLAQRGIRYGSRGHAFARDRVYVSPDRDFARVFATRTAAFAGRGWLYRVVPGIASSLDIDPDFPRGAISLTCSRARVEEVVETNVTVSGEEGLRIIGPHMTWNDGRFVYDADGYMSPAPSWEGADSEQMRSLGVWRELPSVGYNQQTKKAFLR